MQVKPLLCAAAMAFVSFSASAQTQAPGLWEHSFTMKSDDPKVDAAMAQMQKQMAAMPPEQRKQMEAAMAGRGIKLGAGGTSVQVCITKEQAAKPPEARMSSGHCTQKDMQRSGNTMKFKFECTQPPSTGEGEMTFISDKAYSGKTLVTSQREGKSQLMTMEMQGKWLASDCGDVKPRTPPTAK
ncbi:MAG: DUF3617 domain-containing protein [Burkholderiales bacterium]